MASWVFKVGVSVLLAAQFSNAQLPSSTRNGNLSVTATSPSVPIETGGPCCVVVPITVGLNWWWNQTLTATIATVITQIYQYNDTRITSTTTISSNQSVEDVTAPAGIIPGTFIYSMSFIGTETTVSFPNTVVASPTPFVVVNQIGVVYGTWKQATGGPTCGQTTMDMPRQMKTGYGYVEDPPIVRTTPNAYANAPGTELIDFWIAQTPTLTDDIPGLETCSVPSGSGEPSVHIPVTGLTSHATTTINVDGGGPAPTVSRSTNVPAEPITTPEVTPTNAPEPEPTTDTPPDLPPAEETETSPAPENTNPNDPEQPAPTTIGSNPDPNPNNPEQPVPTSAGSGSNPNLNPNNPDQPAPTTGGSPNNPQQPSPTSAGSGSNPNPNNPDQPAPTTGGSPNNPQQPAPSSAGSGSNPNPNPNNPDPPAPTSAGTPDNSNPSNPNPGSAPGATLPIDLTPVPAPVPAPTAEDALSATQPINAPAIILPNGQTLSQGTITTISDHTISIPTGAPSVTVIDGTTVQAPPVVVVDGTTATLAPTSVAVPVLSVTVGEGSSASVVAITAAPTSGGGVVLPNGETLLPGSTTTYLGETLVLTTAESGGTSVVQVVDGSTTEIITVPTAASSSVFVYGNSTTTGRSGSPSQTTSVAPEEATGAGTELLSGGTVAVLAALGAAVVLDW